jgi:glycosyltransferase involved in cell wall biosynthesis
MKSVLFVQPNLTGMGGIEKVIPALAESISTGNYAVYQCSFYGDKKERVSFWSGVHILGEQNIPNLCQKIKKILKRTLSVYLYIKEIKPKVIIVSAQGASILVMVLKYLRLVKLPVIVYVHQAFSASDRGYSKLAKFLYRYADKIVCVSTGVADEYRLFLSADKVVVIHNPVILPKKISKITHADNAPIFITASRLEDIRGVGELVDVMISYFQHQTGSLWILGEGSLLNKLKKKVSNANLSDRIKFIGPVDNVYDYLHTADVYIATPKAEAFGVAIVEALNSGLPVFVSDAPYGPREVLGFTEGVTTEALFNKVGVLLPRTDNMDFLQQELFLAIEKWRSGKWIFDVNKQHELAATFSIDSSSLKLQAVIEKVL